MPIPLFEDNSPGTYDAIVVGSGISGGWAAKQLCEAGLKTLVLERGRHIEHGDYPTASTDPWDWEDEGHGEHALREKLSPEAAKHYEKQARTGYTTNRSHVHHFVKDTEHPYQEEPGGRFDWMRGYHTGGRSLVWGRQSYRWSDIDFEANKRDGIAVDWPIRYADLKPYYDKVEKYIGVSGMAENWARLARRRLRAAHGLYRARSLLARAGEGEIRRSHRHYRPHGPPHRPGRSSRAESPVLPISQSLHARLSLRRLLLFQRIYASGCRQNWQPYPEALLHRPTPSYGMRLPDWPQVSASLIKKPRPNTSSRPRSFSLMLRRLPQRPS